MFSPHSHTTLLLIYYPIMHWVPWLQEAALKSVLQSPSWLPCRGVLSLLQTLVSQHFGLCRVRQQTWFTNICCFLVIVILTEDFPGSADGKESACSAEDLGSIPKLERSPAEENVCTPLHLLPGKSHAQRRLVGYSPWSHKESDMTKWLTHTHTFRQM